MGGTESTDRDVWRAVLSGDSHAAWASNLHDGEGLIVGVEFGATAVSSPQPSSSKS